MRRHLLRWTVLTLIVVTTPLTVVASSTPSIRGIANGIELCPLSVCLSAIFAGGFQGKVAGWPTAGFFAAGIIHTPLPSLGETADVTGGQWTIQTWRGKFSGYVAPGGTLLNLDDTRYCVEITMVLVEGGSGDVTFTGILDHGPFPPTIDGPVTQLPFGGCTV